MCKLSFKNNVSFVAVRSPKFKRKLDYYLIIPGRGYEYAFTKELKVSCYEVYRRPVSLNMAMRSRYHNTALMNLRKYLHYMMPYLVEYLGLESIVINKDKKDKKERRRSLVAA